MKIKIGKRKTANRKQLSPGNRARKWSAPGGRDPGDGRVSRKQYPRWYCEQRKIATLPFVWARFQPDKPGNGVPIGGAAVLVAATGWEGKVLVVPREYRYEETAQLFKQHRVEWWGYLPALPKGSYPRSGELRCDDFFHYARWELVATGKRGRTA